MFLIWIIIKNSTWSPWLRGFEFLACFRAWMMLGWHVILGFSFNNSDLLYKAQRGSPLSATCVWVDETPLRPAWGWRVYTNERSGLKTVCLSWRWWTTEMVAQMGKTEHRKESEKGRSDAQQLVKNRRNVGRNIRNELSGCPVMA